MTGPRITEETLRALAAIAYFGEATPVQIRTKSGLASGTLSPILARLKAVGWLERRLESREAKPVGKQARQFYRIRDVAAVKDAARGVKILATQLLEDVS